MNFAKVKQACSQLVPFPDRTRRGIEKLDVQFAMIGMESARVRMTSLAFDGTRIAHSSEQFATGQSHSGTPASVKDTTGWTQASIFTVC